MKSKIYRWAIRVAMRRPAPSRIPLSGDERLRKRNYAAVYLEQGDDQTFLVREVEQKGFRGLWFAGKGAESEERFIPNDELSNYEFLIIYYFGELEIKYRSAVEFLLHKAAFIPHLFLVRERLARRIFNRRTLTRSDSIYVLRRMLEETTKNPQYGNGPSTLMTLLYGPRWTHHPQLEEMYMHYGLVLDSLKQSGDLKYEHHGYRITPQAVKTLEQFDRDDQKFRQDFGLQRKVFWLAVVVAIIGAVQTYVAYLAVPA